MAKTKQMMETDEKGIKRQFFPVTHAGAVLGLKEFLEGDFFQADFDRVMALLEERSDKAFAEIDKKSDAMEKHADEKITEFDNKIAATNQTLATLEKEIYDTQQTFENMDVYTKAETDVNVINQIGGAESAVLKKELLVNGVEGTASRYVKDLPYENKLQNGNFSRKLYAIGTGTNNGHSVRLNANNHLEVSYDSTQTTRGNVFFAPSIVNFLPTDVNENIPVYAYIKMRSKSGTVRVHGELFGGNTPDIREVDINSDWGIYKLSLLKRKLTTFYLWIASNESATIEIEWVNLTTKEMTNPFYYPAAEDYGIVHGQPNLLNGTSNEWVDYTFTSWDDGKNFGVNIEDVGLRAGDTITFAAEMNNKTGTNVAVSKLFINKDSENLLQKSGNPISVGSIGISSLTVTIPEGANKLFWYRVAKGGNTIESTIAARGHRLFKGSSEADDGWKPSQSDSGLTPINNGMVPFTDEEYATLLSEDGSVLSETLDFGKGAGTQFDFTVIKTLEEKYPFLFKDNSTIAEKISKYKSILKQFRLTHTSRGGGISTTSGNVINRSRMRIKTGSTTWGGIGDTNTTNRFIPVTTPWIEPYRNIMNDDGTITASVVSKNNNVVEAGAVSDGITKAWVEVQDIRLTVELEVNGQTIIEEMIAAYHRKNEKYTFEKVGEV